MGWWGEQVVPRMVDRLGNPPEVREDRRLACAGLAGDVLEIGFGSGVNLPYYPPGVTSLAAVEPSAVARRLAAPRLPRLPFPLEFSGVDAAGLPFPDARFDTALSTLTLCSIPDPAAAVREVRRVLKPHGVFFFLEHGVAPDPSVQRWQRRLEPLQKRALGGCHLTRDVPELFAGTGLKIEGLQASYLDGPAASRPFSYIYRGWARRVT